MTHPTRTTALHAIGRMALLLAPLLAGCGSGARQGTEPQPVVEPAVPAGQLDPAYGEGGVVRTSFGENVAIAAIALQADGSIVAAGVIGEDLAVVRFAANGATDPTFGNGAYRSRFGAARAAAYAVIALSDGRVVAGGVAGDMPVLLRLTPQGELDPTFAGGGVALPAGAPAIADLALQADGRIVTAGSSRDAAALARYEPDGELDRSFGDGGTLLQQEGQSGCGFGSVSVQPDGHIVAGGSCFLRPPALPLLVRYERNGGGQPQVILPTASASLQSVRVVTDLGVVKSGAIIACFADAPQVTRLDAEGATSPSFGEDGISPIPELGLYLSVVASDAAGRIVAAGYFLEDAQRPVPQLAVARFTADGLPDPSFGANGFVVTPLGSESRATGLVVQPDGKIVVAVASDGDFVLARYGSGDVTP